MTDKSHLHYRYSIAIIVLIAIFVVTLLCRADNQLVAYIGFASTLIGLVLSSLAIIYAFFSNHSLSETTGTLNKASASIADESQKLTTVLDELRSTIKVVPSTLAAHTERLDHIVGLVSSPPGTHLPADPANPNQQHAGLTFTEEDAQTCVSKCSPIGLRSLHLASRLFETGKRVELVQAARLIGEEPFYSYGYLVAFGSLPLLTLSRPGEDSLDVSCTSFNSNLLAALKSNWDSFQKRDAELWPKPTTPDQRDLSWATVSAALEQLISAAPKA